MGQIKRILRDGPGNQKSQKRRCEGRKRGQSDGIVGLEDGRWKDVP